MTLSYQVIVAIISVYNSNNYYYSMLYGRIKGTDSAINNEVKSCRSSYVATITGMLEDVQLHYTCRSHSTTRLLDCV